MRLRNLILPLLALAIGLNHAAAAADAIGAGATFPAPIYNQWADTYKAAGGGDIGYRAVGSGQGIRQIKAGEADFGASDVPLSAEELREGDLVQFPMVIGGVVVVANIPSVDASTLHLDGPTLASIFLGKVTRWNDPAIARTNPGVALPDIGIVQTHRSDASGSTFLFTTYLSQMSAEWRDNVGSAAVTEWPNGLGGRGTDGEGTLVSRLPGAIGYVEYAYAVKHGMGMPQLSSKDGAWVKAETRTFQAAAARVDWARAPILVNQPGPEAWPVTGASFILMHAKTDKPERAQAALRFFHWSLSKGGQAAETLSYVPLPPATVKAVEDAWAQSLRTADGRQVWTGR
jgi:phosphate transport system substrate-binding protein